jgi:FkbM family methyltransferase
MTSYIYYYNNKYNRPIHLIYIDSTTVKCISSYWGEVIGTYNSSEIKLHTIGTGKVCDTSIDFGRARIWKQDLRKNIVFIGANDMLEIEKYVNTYNNGLFIEAIPKTYERLQNNLLQVNSFNVNYKAINALVTSTEEKEYKFNIFNNNEASSSIYEPDPSIWAWEHVKVDEEITLVSTTMERVLKDEKWDTLQYDMVLDVQGAELEVLKGFGIDNLKNIHKLTVEISTQQFYKGGVLFNELDDFLVVHGFKLTNPPTTNHCDVVYTR